MEVVAIMKRFFQLERAALLLMAATMSQKVRFVARLRQAGIIVNAKSLCDPRVGVVVRRHDGG